MDHETMDDYDSVEGLAGDATSASASVANILNPVYIVKYLIDNPNLCIAAMKIYGMALFVIYVGAHVTLDRPPSAAPDESKADGKDKKKTNKNIEKELRLVDALVLPLFATAGLGGMYLLLKYLKDPAIISKILRFNMVFLSVVSGGAMFGGALSLATSITFPDVWTSRDGSRIYRIDATKRQQSWAAIGGGGGAEDDDDNDDEPVWTEDEERSTPFPDAVACLVHKQLVPAAWALRSLLRQKWTIQLFVWLGAEGDEAVWSLFDFAGAGFVIVVGVMYLFFSDLSKPGVLNNLLGLGTTFVALPLISGTSFVISTAILVAMFVYDLVMVFYTPLMITVATSVQAPLMVMASSSVGGSASRKAGLGLGDLTVPGIFICLCLRYDLYRFYCSKIKNVQTMLESETRAVVDGAPVTSVSAVEAPREVKATYVDPRGHWGDWLWTGALRKSKSSYSGSGSVAEKLAPGVAASSFPKTYFNTAMVSYLAGLVLANAAVEYTGKGQPALFYIVPVMLLATWGQAWYTGNLDQMWNYTEDGSLDTKEVVVDVITEAEAEEKPEAIDAKAVDEGVSSGLSARELRAQKRALAKTA